PGDRRSPHGLPPAGLVPPLLVPGQRVLDPEQQLSLFGPETFHVRASPRPRPRPSPVLLGAVRPPIEAELGAGKGKDPPATVGPGSLRTRPKRAAVASLAARRRGELLPLALLHAPAAPFEQRDQR